MDERASGIVLRVRPLTETSLIVNWLTRESGRISTVAKGARRPKSVFRGKLDLFYLADFSFGRSRRSELHALREVSLVETFPPLRRDFHQLQQATYGAALIEQVTENETPLPLLFDLFLGFLRYLIIAPSSPTHVFAFELKLLHESGLQPDVRGSRLTEGTKQMLRRLEESNWDGITRFKLSAAQSREAQEFLHGFLLFHLGKIPASRTAAIAGEVKSGN
jgi:DNA repair protein RecO (recombination protein O)